LRATAHLFVNEPKREKAVREAVRAAGVTGSKWHPDSVGFEQENQCGECRRDGHFHTGRYPLELAYPTHVLGNAPDVTWTYERFGNSKLGDDFSESHFAAPQLLVSPRFREVLVKAGVRNVEFLPVRAVVQS
jgi:hypothetical protein